VRLVIRGKKPGICDLQRVVHTIFKGKSSWYFHGMTYVVKVPFEVSSQLPESDSDVRSVSRLPGFVRLELVDPYDARYELTLEVEAGSTRDAMDAADELFLDYENALGAYRPRLLAGIVPELR
jgi:hypothetical protein